ncbi:MAG: YicC/YloC family endoribonuclease [Bacteriovoracaceae bacterium]|jgi:uncharacterized protein (TIGR00255 family)|nr:YicC/YloC family endoribonuclease [Bacteriovoracaceae bacterium]
MSIQSMTGFGKGEAESDYYTLSVEIKSVNHRFKDLRFKMGSFFNQLELKFKKKIEQNFSRGSFDIYVNYKKTDQSAKEFQLDSAKVEAYIDTIQKITNKKAIELSIRPTEFLKSDFQLEDENKEEELISLITPAFEQALQGLQESRSEEGKSLVVKLKEHQEKYIGYFDNVKASRGQYQAKVKEKLLKRFETENKELSIDEPRFLQEVIYYLEKLDIDEEINRISIHLQKLDKLLDSGNDEVGRQIDFLIQELNRETNTIGSKSGDSEISASVVQMKVQLEKIREQALNLQ